MSSGPGVGLGRRRPPRWAIDWAPVAILPPVFVLDAAIAQSGRPLTVLNVVCAVVVCLPLAWRRRLGLAPLVALVIPGVVLVMWQLRPGNTVVLLPIIAVYELARRLDRRRSVWIAALCIPGVLAGVLPFASGFSLELDLVVRNLFLCLFAVAAGDSVRARGEASERAADLREQETLRRVADERLRIAHEIHDVVAHGMTAINVQAGVAAHLLARDPEQAHGALRDIKRVSGEALGELRATLDVLRTPGGAVPLAPTGGLSDLSRLLDGLRAAGVAIEVEVRDLGRLPAPVDHASYRIIQEAVTNVARHSGADHARVAVARRDETLFIEVTDDGRGSAADGHTPAGNGLQGMRERVAALADDQALVRAGFRALLNSEADISVVAEADDGQTAVAAAREHHPDVVLMDIRMPGTDGLAATAQITGDPALAQTRVVVLTTFELDEYVFGALRAGASGFLLKDLEPEDLLAAVRVVAGGDALLTPRLTRRLIEAFVAAGPAPAGLRGAEGDGPEIASLTPREREVLALVGRGASNAEIAATLVVSPLTAKTHVARLFAKLGARDRAQLVVLAYESGLVTPGTAGRAAPDQTA